VTLPPNKWTYDDWKASGETFSPVVEQRLDNAANDYDRLEVAGTYRGRPDLTPRPKPRIIGTDAAPMFEGVRDILNGLIHAEDVRGGSHLNLEQHPDEVARPLVEAGVDLRRDKATLEDVQLGPPSSRPPRLTELGVDEGKERLQKIRQHPVRVIAEGVSSAMSLPSTILDVAGTAIKHLPAGGEAARNLAQVRSEWVRRQKLAIAGGERLDKLSIRLRRQAAGLIIWE
jgi:hypothetical protein